MAGYSYRDYIAWERLPHLWCPGCGHGIILKALAGALAELGLPPEKTLLATGIGCAGRSGDYVTCHRFQGTHGRTLAFATGAKLARPEMKVVCVMGDGDAAAIGGNHLLHAARRNMDVTAVVSNNFNYGMTGGQYSPLTPADSISSTSRQGTVDAPMDICSLANWAGANYVARSTVYHVTESKRFLREALQKKGFSLVEIISNCPTYYGRYNRLGAALEMMDWFKHNVIPLEKHRQLPVEEQVKFFWRGCLADRSKPGFLERSGHQVEEMTPDAETITGGGESL
ncbi:thiamine pyrophosphate-dependent enzyme [Phosphitispora fastidiosa]|uniref:thiamine pyrophosphate-dependent enzyme n=1 Tax=Phosphitispora fastidiosa TaxID=2837202 RepID=UPI001E2FDDFE|nr:thiamine pyrophosphate-dependent enzyme [Phosphitispora fastidiosa]MBU7006971.1 2-oxoglutarate ferredoxin oxidoreductase subunit beta [Phosphitispora fastidiosa]